MRRYFATSALLLLAIGALSCVRQHITPSYGRSFTLALERQEIIPPAGKIPQAVTGLDSQEASIIANGYIASLARKGAPAEEQPILFVAPQSQMQPRYALPPPSVPSER